jgi:peptidoglycan hydrolase-like protein with peptidoglycan-binding domain
MWRRCHVVLFALCWAMIACWTGACAPHRAYAGSADSSPPAAGVPASDFVKSLQRELKRAGYDPGAVDGKMGPTTRYALKQFQQAQGLPPTGTPDIPTLTRLLGRELPR